MSRTTHLFERRGRRPRLAIQLGAHPAAIQSRRRTGLVEVERLRLSRTASMEPPAEWLRRWFSGDAIARGPARLLIPSDSAEHVLLDAGEPGLEVAIEAALPRGEPGTSRPRAWAADVAGDQSTLVAIADRADVDRACAVAAEAEVEVEHVTTVLLALTDLARVAYAAYPSIALLCVESGGAHVVHLRRGEVRAVGKLELQATLAVERSVQAALGEWLADWLQQRGPIDRLVLAGTLPDLDTLVLPLDERLPVVLELFALDAVASLAESATGGADEGRGSIAPARVARSRTGLAAGQRAGLAALVGVARLSVARANLLPSDLRNRARDRTFSRLIGVGVVGVCVLLLTMAAAAVLDVARQRRTLTDLQERLARTMPELDGATAVELARRTNRARRALVDDHTWEPTLIAAGLRRISIAAPEALQVESIDWRRRHDSTGRTLWDAHVTGTVRAGTATIAQADFNRFFAALLDDALVHDLRLVEPLVVEGSATVGERPAGGLVRFSVAVELVAAPRGTP